MAKITRKLETLRERLEKLEKKHARFHAAVAKDKKARLDASQNALSIVEQVTGAPLIKRKRR
jgi:hypothetical protein